MTMRFLLRIVAVGLATAGLGSLEVAHAALPCQSPTGDCVLATKTTIPTGTYDIRPRNLVVQNKEITVGGAGTFQILAANITLQPGARFISNEPTGNVLVQLNASGTVDLQREGTSKSRVDVTGGITGGRIELIAVGTITVNGTLVANATDQSGFGGAILVHSETGNVTVGGDPVGEDGNGGDVFIRGAAQGSDWRRDREEVLPFELHPELLHASEHFLHEPIQSISVPIGMM